MATVLGQCPTRVFVLAAPMADKVEVRYYASVTPLVQAVVDGHGQGWDKVSRQLVFGSAYVLTDGTTPAADLTDLFDGAFALFERAEAAVWGEPNSVGTPAQRRAVVATRKAFVAGLVEQVESRLTALADLHRPLQGQAGEPSTRNS